MAVVKRRRWRAQRRVFLFFDLLLLGGIGLFFFLSSAYFRVATITVTGNVKVANQDVVQAAGLPAKANLWQVNLVEVKRRVEAQPWIKEAVARREFPGRLVITVKEREAMAAVPNNNTFFVIDRDARVLALVDNFYGLGLPVLTGVRSEEWRVGLTVNSEALQTGLVVIGAVDAAHRAMLAEVHVAGRDDGTSDITAYTTGRATVLLGSFRPTDGDLLRRKVEALAGILDDIAASKLQVRQIDLRFDGPPVIKLDK
ncbi:MAG: cell division protein FtsQ/DivIB [Bacillota bacterium]